MNRDEEPVLEPFYNYHGFWRRPARRSIPPSVPEPSNNPSPLTTEGDSIEEEVDSYNAQPDEPEIENHAEPIIPWNTDHYEPFPLDPNHECTDPTTPSHYYSEPEPSYHPATEDSEPDSPNLNLNDLEIEDQADPGSPTHSSVDDNFDYPDIQLLEDEVAEPEDFYYVLNDNDTLVILLENFLIEATNLTSTTQGKYLVFLTLISNYQANNRGHSPADWVRTTLYFFPYTRFWARISNELLDDGPILSVSIHLRYLKSLVRLYM